MLVEPLSKVSAEAIEPVLEEELLCWKNELFWDYRPAAELIKKYINSASLAGYVLKTGDGTVAGYGYYVVDPPVGYIGNLYVRHQYASAQAYGTLLESAFDTLRYGSRLKRIECQLFPFNHDLEPMFTRCGFTACKRYFLCRSLQVDHCGLPARPASSFRILPWNYSYFTSAAEVVFDSYRGSGDVEICHDYQSLRGCIRFLRNLLESPGCGSFSQETSFVAIDERGTLLAVLMTSIIGPRTGMIPQVSVRRDRQGNGLGTLLLATYFERARQIGLKRVALSVSEANDGAFKLYSRLGFEEAKSFHAFIWDSIKSGSSDDAEKGAKGPEAG